MTKYADEGHITSVVVIKIVTLTLENLVNRKHVVLLRCCIIKVKLYLVYT